MTHSLCSPRSSSSFTTRDIANLPPQPGRASQETSHAPAMPASRSLTIQPSEWATTVRGCILMNSEFVIRSGRGAISQTASANSLFIKMHPLTIVAHSRSEEHTSELQSRGHLVCRLLLE